MKLSPAKVVTGWALLNVALILILLGFGEGPVGEIVYPASAVIIFVFAVTVLLAGHGRPPPQQVVRIPGGIRYVIWFAVGAFLCGMGITFAAWIFLLGLFIALGAVIGLIHSPRPAKAPDPAWLAALPDRAAPPASQAVVSDPPEYIPGAHTGSGDGAHPARAKEEEHEKEKARKAASTEPEDGHE